VYLDAFVPEDGESLADMTRNQSYKEAAQKGEIAIKPAFSAVALRVNEDDRAWVDALSTPQPTATLVDKVTVTGARDRIAKKTYIRGKAFPNPVFDRHQARLANTAGWQVHELPCGHMVMVDYARRTDGIIAGGGIGKSHPLGRPQNMPPTIGSRSASGTLNSLIAARKFSRATSGLSNVVAEPNGQRSETVLVGRASLPSRLANTTLFRLAKGSTGITFNRSRDSNIDGSEESSKEKDCGQTTSLEQWQKGRFNAGSSEADTRPSREAGSPRP
jgi:hypothetical protein